MRRPQSFKLAPEPPRVSFIQRRESAICRPVVLTKELHHLSGREGVRKVVEASRHLEIRDPVAQPFAHHCLITPEHWRWHPRRRDELGKGLEHLAHESFARPIS